MKQPLISVIVPVYKVEPYLDKCVSSIVNQTYTNLEIILVDDGSPDNCPAMCDAWAERDSRIRVIHQKNQGGGAARNAGLDFASGSLIAFVDSDDYILTMLSLAELGVGGAIVYALYKPLAENDEGLSQILCKHGNAVQIEQNIFKAEAAQATAALPLK